ncbi:protein unc-45 homolog B-like isoform X2 [Temnothorax americanus]
MKISAKVSQMLDVAFNVSTDNEKREAAMNNLLVLARERVGADEICKKGGVSKIVRFVKVEKNEEVIGNAIRIVGELCQNDIDRTESIVEHVGLLWCLEVMNSTSAERVNASQYCLQNILNIYSGMSEEPDSKPDKALCEAHEKEIDTILSGLLNSVTSRTLTGLARDAIIQLIMRNIYLVTTSDWAERFVELRGVEKLMDIASEMEDYKYESSMDITSFTRTIISVCIANIFENVHCNAAKKKFINAIDEFIRDKLLSSDTESKVRIVLAITLIFGPLDIADSIICKKEVVEMILAMAKADDVLQQKVVCECIVAAITKCKRANKFILGGRDILQNLYYSKHDSIRIRALVGLCKLTIFENGLCSPTIKLFPYGATKKLSKICRRFLINPKKEKDMSKWAIKGLSYLTFDDDVKDELIEDQQAVRAMIELARSNTKTDDQSVFYAALTTLVNLCNAYVEQEHIPEMIELVMFAKRYFEGYNLFDRNAEGRRSLLAKAGVISALASLAEMDSQNCKELIARIFNMICCPREVREIVVQQGGTKALLSLALNGTDKGKKEASEALVLLGLNKHPKIAFPGQMMMEVVRPIINLLNPECSILENSATLLVLCDLAKVNGSMREHICKEGVFRKIEVFLNDEDHGLKCGSLTLINLLFLSHEVVVQYFEQDNSRVKHLTLLCKNANVLISLSAATALMMLTEANKGACKQIYDSNFCLESLRFLLTSPYSEVQEKGILIVTNMIRSTKDVAAKLVRKGIMKLLAVLSKSNTAQNKVKDLAFLALEEAAERREESREAIINMIRERRSGHVTLDLPNYFLRELAYWNINLY